MALLRLILYVGVGGGLEAMALLPNVQSCSISNVIFAGNIIRRINCIITSPAGHFQS